MLDDTQMSSLAGGRIGRRSKEADSLPFLVAHVWLYTLNALDRSLTTANGLLASLLKLKQGNSN